MKECITHHICDCKQAEMDRLRKQAVECEILKDKLDIVERALRKSLREWEQEGDDSWVLTIREAISEVRGNK